ncbi:MAG: tRNA (N(6)-L-threonylcarbamoyladenosine(37)-C(2))-methylthiotransferase MtaB [Candidatus Omnitrophica bacterium]|nr:tRNA (N(6)-L-threonylcarbamoyladenosine(37)-C(2))-methylthiotransferase MtaB [Candidatus Omnitrophota bacterium]
MKTCAFFTLGCKVNQYETQSIRESFLRAGYKEAAPNEPCDVYVINTCTVTEKTDRESRRLIRKAHRQNPSAKIVVTGCYAELDSDEINSVSGVSFIIKNADKDKITEIVDPGKSVRHRTKTGEYAPGAISDFKDRSKAFLKIQDGCNNFCSYCKVPLVRGYSVSRPADAVLGEMKRLIAGGFKEIILTGICLGAWGEELTPKRDLTALVAKIIAIKGNFRIRLSSIEPKYVNNALLTIIKHSPKLCKHLHIPLQSGDDKVLKMMNRPYTFAEYAGIIGNAKSKVPGISVTTDILLGFPGEGDRNFRNTCKLIERVKPSRVHIFPYSRRKGTMAVNLPGEVPRHVIDQRFRIMDALALKTSYEYRKNFLGKTTEVLAEAERDKESGLLKGYDDKYISIILTGTASKGADKYAAKLVPVRIQKVDGPKTYGSILEFSHKYTPVA